MNHFRASVLVATEVPKRGEMVAEAQMAALLDVRQKHAVLSGMAEVVDVDEVDSRANEQFRSVCDLVREGVQAQAAAGGDIDEEAAELANGGPDLPDVFEDLRLDTVEEGSDLAMAVADLQSAHKERQAARLHE